MNNSTRLRIAFSFFAAWVLCCPDARAQDARSDASPETQAYEELLERHKGLTAVKFLSSLPDPGYIGTLPFDPTKARYFDKASAGLQLTAEEQAIFKKLGFVSPDRDRQYSFPSLYYDIYTHDLPVLVTTDSILHALHRSYDAILMEMEADVFLKLLDATLTAGHEELVRKADPNGKVRQENLRDVDLYLTVALNLLRGAGAAGWDGKTKAASVFGQDGAVLEILKKVEGLAMGDPAHPIDLYGGTRAIDFSQFKPRGHYTKGKFNQGIALKSYFRCLMWLGRADTGWIVLSPDHPGSVVASDPDRELADAVLLTELLAATGGLDRLAAMDGILEFMVGASDNLSPRDLSGLMRAEGVAGAGDLADSKKRDRLRAAIARSGGALQRIRSQFLESDIHDSVKTPPPALFQVFGQRFLLDSFLLSHQVFDSILHDGTKVERYMPQGLDVAAFLGNDEAVRLLEPELTAYPYAANLAAARDYVGALAREFWKENLYQVWLDALRTLDDRSASPNFPKVMRTRAWSRKQLQAELASWAELRRDTILYGKQSYTAGAVCEYPEGYVEPYPDLYARVGFFAAEASRRIRAADWTSLPPDLFKQVDEITKRQTAFLDKMASVLGQLETLARKELDAQPFTDEDRLWLKKTIDERSGGSGPPRYDGWYADLLYLSVIDTRDLANWDPVIADVHTDPNEGQVLEVATGSAQYLLAAVDNQEHLTAYVGPVYSYYEFPSSDRLTDEEWQALFPWNKALRPAWTEAFRVPAAGREGYDPARDKDRLSTALIKAIREKDVASTMEILGKGADPNYGKGSDCPLNEAIRGGAEADMEMIRLLVEKGADVNPSELVQGTPLLNALNRQKGPRRLELVTYLLDHGADPLFNRNHPERVYRAGRSALHVAAAHMDPDLVSLLLERGSDVNDRDSGGDTPLHRAIESLTSKNDRTPLPEAARTVNLLVEAGADVNARNRKGVTPTLMSFGQDCLSGEKLLLVERTVRLLLKKGGEPFPKDHEGWPAIHRAAVSSDELVRLLIEKGADVNGKVQGGSAPLHIAVGRCFPRMEKVKNLLNAGADPNAKDANGNTPLHLLLGSNGSCWFYNDMAPEGKDVLKALIDAGADPRINNARGNSPLKDHLDLNIRTCINTGEGMLDYWEQIGMILESIKPATVIEAH